LVDEKKEQPLLQSSFARLFLWGYDTRCIEKEVSKVPIFEDGTFKYLPFTTTTTTNTTNTTSTTTTHFQKS